MGIDQKKKWKHRIISQRQQLYETGHGFQLPVLGRPIVRNSVSASEYVTMVSSAVTETPPSYIRDYYLTSWSCTMMLLFINVQN